MITLKKHATSFYREYGENDTLHLSLFSVNTGKSYPFYCSPSNIEVNY
jgi:hypothetical protein